MHSLVCALTPSTARKAIWWRLAGVLCLALALSPQLAQAEALRGTPLLRRYLPEDYNAPPQHLAIATDREGRIYVGNTEGVLRYDGLSWDLIPLPGGAPARDVAIGNDGNIYTGNYDSYGWLRTTEDGAVVYQELLTASGLTARARAIGTVEDVLIGREGVYFHAEHALYFLSYDHRRAAHWLLTEDVDDLFIQDDVLYARIVGKGLSRFIAGHFQLVPGGERFAGTSLIGMIGKSGWRLLISDEGFFRADAQGIQALPNNAGVELEHSDAHAVLSLVDGSFVVGTLNGELFHYGADYRLLGRVSLSNYAIQALGTDQQGGLWAATDGDLVRLSMPSPWSLLGAAQGVHGIVEDFEWYNGALWVASSRGFTRVFKDELGDAHSEQPYPSVADAYALAGTDSGLLMGFRSGLMALDAGSKTPRMLLEGERNGVHELLLSSHDPDRAYGIGTQQLFVLQRRLGLWQLAESYSLDGASAATLTEVAGNEVWFANSRGGPQRWRFAADGKLIQREAFANKHEGLELDPQRGNSLYVLDGQVHVISGEHGFHYDGQHFIPDPVPPLTLTEWPAMLRVETTPLGTYAFTSRQLWFRPSKEKQWQQLHPGSQQASGYSRIRYNHDGVVRAATWSGLLEYNPAERDPALRPLVLRFDRVSADDGSGEKILYLPLQSRNTPVNVTSGYHLRFRFSVVNLDSPVQFRYRLLGLSDEWGDWTDRDLFIRALAPGDYVLEVKARTGNDRMAGPVTYRLRILPRWYERVWVRAIGLLLLLGLLILIAQEIIRRRTERYLAANRKLEARIAERTHELETVNRKLAELATEDALTGIANRRALEHGLQREWVRCQDQRRSLSALMIDVDHFKRYNDAHGHLEGDVLLRTIAQRLRSLHDPKRELLARYGGEEFALLLPGVDQDEALRRADSIRLVIQQELGEITVSIGVAGFIPTVQSEFSNLLRRADAALYRAKRAGRNRVEADIEPEN